MGLTATLLLISLFCVVASVPSRLRGDSSKWVEGVGIAVMFLLFAVVSLM
ncbi:hypothetical protein [uncultured Bifidobacterium sp.]|nr:hypothetical protein [uncultured Bifidobacterium sp.]